MELSAATLTAVRTTWDWFSTDKELTEESETIHADYLKNIADVAVEPHVKELAEESYQYWMGHLATDHEKHPRLAGYRFNGMYNSLYDLAILAGLARLEAVEVCTCTAKPVEPLNEIPVSVEESIAELHESLGIALPV